MKNRSTVAVSSLFLLFTAGACLAQETETLTLERAIELALQANRGLQSSALDTAKAGEQIAALRTRRYPGFQLSALGAQKLTSLDFRFDRGSLGVLPGIGPVPATDTTIHTPLQFTGLFVGQMSQPLAQLHKIKLNLQQLRLSADSAKEKQREQQQSLVNQVKRLYYGILQTQSGLQAVEESLQLYRELDRVTSEYVAQQTALPAQNLEVKARLVKAEYDALSLRNPILTQKEQLNSLLGRDIRTEFRVTPVPELELQETDLEGARRLALTRRPEIRDAKLKSQQAEQDRRIKKADYIPEVSLTLHYISPINYGKLIPANIATAGVQVQLEPFDWGRRRHELLEKDKTIRQADLGVREAESQVLLDVGNRFRKLEEARKLLDVARAVQSASRENLRVMTNRYKEQAALLKDVLQSQVSLADANNQYQQALLGFWTAKADFEKAMGQDQ